MNDSELAKRIAEAVNTLREWNPLMHPNWEHDATAEICKVTAPLESELAAAKAEADRKSEAIKSLSQLATEYEADNATLRQQVEELRKDAERYRLGKAVYAHKLTVRPDGKSLWRYCEPDPLIGRTFDEAWDQAIMQTRAYMNLDDSDLDSDGRG